MTHYDYKVVPAPKRAKRVRGVRGAEELFALTLTDAINEVARQGWEYVRAEHLPAEAPGGWFRGGDRRRADGAGLPPRPRDAGAAAGRRAAPSPTPARRRGRRGRGARGGARGGRPGPARACANASRRSGIEPRLGELERRARRRRCGRRPKLGPADEEP